MFKTKTAVPCTNTGLPYEKYEKGEMINMFNFFKKYIVYISVMLSILELASCIVNSIGFEFLWGFSISLIFAILIFFLNCIVFNNGYVSEKDIFVLFGIGFVSIIFCVLSFIKKNCGYTYISLLASTVFITEFVLIKIFDIKEY